MVQGQRFRVQGLGFRVQDIASGCRVEVLTRSSSLSVCHVTSVLTKSKLQKPKGHPKHSGLGFRCLGDRV